MGYKIETHAWVNQGDGNYEFEQVYGGNSLIRALIAGFRAKRAGAGMVKVEWR